jgi:hypothetical protein
MSAPDLGKIMAAWARRQGYVTGLTLFGSRQRPAAERVWRADDKSDWDFQVITTRPEDFRDRAWAAALPGVRLLAYGVSPGRIGGVTKVNLLFAGTEADLVILPHDLMVRYRRAVRRGLHRRPGPERTALQDLAMVIRAGWRFLAGARDWQPMFRAVVADIPDPRLDDAAVRNLADCFWCDLVSLRHKVARGEIVAAQRLLHQSLAETNIRLLHEARLRRGDRSFREGRRLELVAPPAEIRLATVDARPTRQSLRRAADRAAAGCALLVRELLGEAWRPPALR